MQRVALPAGGDAPARKLNTDARLAWKRLADVAVGSVTLVVLAPALLLVAMAIWAEDGLPVLFHQKRLGRDGREFTLLKFRKFRNRHTLGDCPLTLKHDPRLTKVGNLLERMKIDELPQFWNVLKGDMSLVGPRPETPYFADCFKGAYRDVLRFKPGIFGPSQAVFRDESTLHHVGSDPEQFYRDVLFPLKARIDLAYFPHANARLDLRWTLRCILAVLGRRFLPGRGADHVQERVESCLHLLAGETKR
jgi:lipopolysaccharide/colanic/teichoic acid biosynthesis glycosyltransferase